MLIGELSEPFTIVSPLTSVLSHIAKVLARENSVIILQLRPNVCTMISDLRRTFLSGVAFWLAQYSTTPHEQI